MLAFPVEGVAFSHFIGVGQDGKIILLHGIIARDHTIRDHRVKVKSCKINLVFFPSPGIFPTMVPDQLRVNASNLMQYRICKLLVTHLW
jgi:hypothetical protein